jgi:hypothetical protein
VFRHWDRTSATSRGTNATVPLCAVMTSQVSGAKNQTGPVFKNVASARLSPSGLGFAHRCATVLVDFHHEATRVVAAREPPQSFRATENDRVGVGARLDRESFRKLSSPSFRVPIGSISPPIFAILVWDHTPPERAVRRGPPRLLTYSRVPGALSA